MQNNILTLIRPADPDKECFTAIFKDQSEFIDTFCHYQRELFVNHAQWISFLDSQDDLSAESATDSFLKLNEKAAELLAQDTHFTYVRNTNDPISDGRIYTANENDIPSDFEMALCQARLGLEGFDYIDFSVLTPYEILSRLTGTNLEQGVRLEEATKLFRDALLLRHPNLKVTITAHDQRAIVSMNDVLLTWEPDTSPYEWLLTTSYSDTGETLEFTYTFPDVTAFCSGLVGLSWIDPIPGMYMDYEMFEKTIREAIGA